MLTIIRCTGIQLTTVYCTGRKQIRFVDLQNIHDLIINEAVSMVSSDSLLQSLLKLIEPICACEESENESAPC